ncbi:MAG: hypothetical protein ABSC94_01150 [Polyangiaceae bacterium]
MVNPRGSAAPDDEPQTPMWLPALGAALFAVLGLVWVMLPSTAQAVPDADVPSSKPPPTSPPAPSAAPGRAAAGSARAVPAVPPGHP